MTDRGPWILTATGNRFHLAQPDPSEISIDDVAAALSKLCRFNGHFVEQYQDVTYSVAQHSVYTMRLLRRFLHEDEGSFWGLMHDATETWYGDVNSPLKSLLPHYRVLEGNAAVVVRQAFNIPHNAHIRDIVHQADMIMFAMESEELNVIPHYEWDNGAFPRSPISLFDLDPGFYPWEPRRAREEFLSAFELQYSTYAAAA